MTRNLSLDVSLLPIYKDKTINFQSLSLFMPSSLHTSIFIAFLYFSRFSSTNCFMSLEICPDWVTPSLWQVALNSSNKVWYPSYPAAYFSFPSLSPIFFTNSSTSWKPDNKKPLMKISNLFRTSDYAHQTSQILSCINYLIIILYKNIDALILNFQDRIECYNLFLS